MTRDNSSRLRCLAQIATLGGFAQPGVSGAKYRLTLGLIEDEEGSPVDGTIETQLDDFDDRLEQALVDATKIWIEFDAVETEMHSPSGPGDQRLRVLRAEDVEIRWDDAPRKRHECPRCAGTGQIDLSIGPPRIVVCKLCGGIGTVLSDQA
ncbi:MAG: hypothetical protein ABEN55_02305 [Bradymonadaceae bacterium]